MAIELTDGAWTDAEITTFQRRVALLEKLGLNEVLAEKTAQTMLYRDRPESGDDRRLCIECKHLSKGVCTQRVGIPDLRLVLQRCDAFGSRSAA